ncbi:deleted in malignant brain tumors 1 protein-like [Hemiscyllium ocellatum]|uniref:deleted in malignant brain tumors 1 protein-like n=1 Tax=Hemiscyllium ocellatum TaxID=170820 RepID=UPI00296664D4|nr:deleted in malignant brain tumors 1 protein-like [Hemiscyllium ocellatum]
MEQGASMGSYTGFDESWSPRLVNGRNRCDGQVEVYYKGSWGRVQDTLWDLNAAHVVCRQLGCGYALETQNSSNYGVSDERPWVHSIQCHGQESQLRDCNIANPLNSSVTDSGGVGILCSEHKEMRLVNGKHRCEGRVEVFYNDAWGTVCSENLDFHDGEVICKQLECGALHYVDYYTQLFGAGTGPIWLDDVECLSHEPTLWQCKRNPWGQHNCEHREDAGVVCSDSQHSVSLVGGSSNCSGRVEILCDKGWGTLCGDSWDTTDANVVCRQLGCGFAVSARGGPTVSQGKGVTWQNDVKCKGSESNLYDCLSQEPMQSECNHKEIASVICSVPHFHGADARIQDQRKDEVHFSVII